MALREGGAESDGGVDGGALVDLVERHGRVVAQSDLSVIAYPPFSGPELLTLDLCASREALSQTARYRLTRSAFARARDFGWDAAEVARRLERLIGAGAANGTGEMGGAGDATGATGALPGSVRVTLSDWERLASRLRLEQGATLLELTAPEALDALLADRASATWGVRRLTATVASISPEAAPRVRAWLLRHGLLPAVSEEASAAVKPPAESAESEG